MKFLRSKLIAILLVLLLSVSLVGCGAKETPAPQEPVKSEETSKASVFTEAVDAYFANKPAHNYKIKQDEFVEKVKAGEEMFVLDIRQPDVYGEGHIVGAVNAPWGPGLADALDKLPSDKPIFVYCYSGQTAGQTVALLNMAGFDVRSVNLGWNFGISKVEGVDEVIETEPNDFPEVAPFEIDSELKEAIVAYFQGLADVKDTLYKNYKISEDDAKKFLDEEDADVVFVSIRSAEDFAKGHIEGSSNIPWGNEMYKEFNTLPTDKKIVIYCYTGQTAGQTVAALKLLGYDAVSLNGGMGMASNEPIGWANKGFSVVE